MQAAIAANGSERPAAYEHVETAFKLRSKFTVKMGVNRLAQTGQQGQQGQMNGQGMQFTDRDILQLCLNESKHLATSMNTYILEANNEQLRRDYMNVLGDTYSQQKQVYDLMQQKGYYQVKNANPQDIAQAQSKFSSQQSQMS